MRLGSAYEITFVNLQNKMKFKKPDDEKKEPSQKPYGALIQINTVASPM
jgi:hypothetical protein